MSFKFNPTTGRLDLIESNDPNFSYINVAESESVEIASGQEMLFQSDMMIDGDLMVSGIAAQLPEIISPIVSEFSFFFTRIDSGASIVIPDGRLMLFANSLIVDGNLLVNGELSDAFSGAYF